MEREALRGGVQRTDLAMNDGRTIRYYDEGDVTRTAVDSRPEEAPVIPLVAGFLDVNQLAIHSTPFHKR